MGIYNPYNHHYDAWQEYNSMNWYNNDTFMPIGLDSLERGDIVYYPGHIGIYLGGGQIINSYPPCVEIDSLYRWNLIGAARPFV